eukprot:GHVO01001225.1.p1 GENE.GHVO01001225.1~~GHVO01001225.1.p1  ORF type:complete len:168 (-),score=21.11 GHVO01001225.1:419-901(-)
MAACCHARSWDGWTGFSSDLEMIFPDVSRVYRRPYEGLSEQGDLLKQLFNRPRVTNMNVDAKLSNVEAVRSQASYDAEIEKMLQTATVLDTSNAGDCLKGSGGKGFYVPQTSGQVLVIYFEQAAISDMGIVNKLCKCFGLFSAPGYDARGLHAGVMRSVL